MNILERVKSWEDARTRYILSMIQKYQQNERLKHLQSEDLLAIAEEHADNVCPRLRRIEPIEAHVWQYNISAGSWAPEFSAMLGRDLNLHCGTGATLSTTGLIGICGAAIAADIGGTLRSIRPVTFRQRVAPGEAVEIKICFKRARSGVQLFTMTGYKIETEAELFDPATITMVGANV